MKKKIAFAAGGTGGHMIPACTLALQLRHFCDLFFCGVDLKNHRDRLKSKNFPYYTLVGGTPFHKNPIRSLKNIALLIVGTWQCWKIYRKEKPDLIVGFGSFHSFPALLAAYLYRIPIILFESNVQEGIVNRFFSKWAVVSTAVFREVHISLKGPVRQVALPIHKPFGICRKKAREYFGLEPDRPTLLVTGGSLGAREINQMIVSISSFLHDKKMQIIHLVGAHENIEELREKYKAMLLLVALKPFEEKMYFAWEAADIAICRAGAATLSELVEFEVPALVIPYRFSSRAHQVSNAKYFSEIVKGGISLCDKESVDTVLETIQTLWENKETYRKKIAFFKRKQFYFPLYQVILEHLQIPISFYLLGIGGIGMSGLAQILLQRGNTVYGSDSRETEMTERLRNLGATITLQSDLLSIPKGSCFVYSSAIQKSYLQSLANQASHSLIMHRSDLLDQFMKEKIPLLVAGTHGKTTTSAMLAHVLEQANVLPSYSIGGIPITHNLHGHLGKGIYFIGEADESDGSFLRTPAFGAIVTNVESDHIEYWKTEKELQKGFDEFLSQVTHPDLLFLCSDDPYLASKNISAVRYGCNDLADYQIKNFRQAGMKSHFTISNRGKEIPLILSLIGKHNAKNASAVFGLCTHLGISELQIVSALESFKGVLRRCEYKGRSPQGGIIYDDYAHHPTEICSTLQAMKEAFPDRRLIALFQPHRYSRLQLLLSEFASSLSIADLLVITDVYSAGESETLGISSSDLLITIEKNKKIPCTYVQRNQIVPHMRSILRDKDILITIGAGDITEIGDHLTS